MSFVVAEINIMAKCQNMVSVGKKYEAQNQLYDAYTPKI